MEKINNLMPFAALTVGQVHEFMSSYIDELKKVVTKDPANLTKEALTADEAISLLNELGYPVTKSSLYKMVYGKGIPYHKKGKRLIFYRKEIVCWMNKTVITPETKSDAALSLAKSVNSKNRRVGNE